MAARYFIGIDLGTSNCALSYIDSKDPSAGTQVFQVPQYASLDTVCEQSTLPAFFYYLNDAEASNLESSDGSRWQQDRVVGLAARVRASSDTPRTIVSAKSWLCHAGVDREQKLLPWKSDAIADSDKCSPVEATSAYLDYLRFAWNQTIGARDKQARFERQDVVITVPASFDTVAQQLTLDAAEHAGYPSSTRLLEEPQAAFYAWLEKHPQADEWEDVLGALSETPKVVLVCDIGGGTSDFSLFELSLEAGAELPSVDRIAVSNHILLGGDNVDLALAHLAESKLNLSSPLSSLGWGQLRAECRELKEQVLSTEGAVDERFTIAFSDSTGGSLFASAQTVSLLRSEVLDTILNGFYPDCSADSKPHSMQGGLREIGLPYANDSAITRHLADFLRQRKVDAILFNGGSLGSKLIQSRIADQVAQWQGGQAPKLLENDELDLAVARGAAWYQASLQADGLVAIDGGSGHSFYIEVSYKPKKRKQKLAEKYLVCVLAQGTEVEASTRIATLDLSLKVNTPVQFQAYTSTCRDSDKGGAIVAFNERDFQKLPIMQTMAELPARAEVPKDGKVAIELEAHLNNLGILKVNCLSVRRLDGENRSWRLAFNLRQGGAGDDASAGSADLGVSTEALEASKDRLLKTFGADSTSQEAARLIKALEKLTHLGRKEWSLPLLRTFWQSHQAFLTRRDHSPEHEVAWLNAAGYFLRPGYGHALDEFYVRTLWVVNELDLAFPKSKANREQYFLLWRRVAGGLTASQQGDLYDAWLEKVLEDTKQSYEPARMLGAFEHLEVEQRKALSRHFVDSIVARSDKFCDHSIWALGRLLNRAPLYGGELAILPVDEVAHAFETLELLDWSRDNLRNLSQTFVQSARIVNHRDHDVSPDLRARIVEKAKAAGFKEPKLKPLEQFTPLDAMDIQQLFGESLPVGLSVGG
ncbi:MAG: Hsp70 family protein [Opitutaceae bacterium]